MLWKTEPGEWIYATCMTLLLWARGYKHTHVQCKIGLLQSNIELKHNMLYMCFWLTGLRFIIVFNVRMINEYLHEVGYCRVLWRFFYGRGSSHTRTWITVRRCVLSTAHLKALTGIQQISSMGTALNRSRDAAKPQVQWAYKPTGAWVRQSNRSHDQVREPLCCYRLP